MDLSERYVDEVTEAELELESESDFWATIEAATEADVDLHDEIAFEHYLTDLRDPDYPNGDLL